MKKESLSTEARTHILRKMRTLLQAGITKLPTERELAGEVAASYPTVRLVMAELEKQGYIRRIQGSGTYLRPQAEKLLKQKLLIFSLPLCNTVELDYAAYCVNELKQAAAAQQYTAEVRQVSDHDEFLRDLFTSANACDAVVYLPPVNSFTMQQIGMLSEFDSVPLIIIDTDMGNIDINNITTDNYQGGMLAAQALFRAGRRNLALLQTEPVNTQTQKRCHGFLEMTRFLGLESAVIDCGVIFGQDCTAKTYDSFNQMLRSGTRFDGIFCISDAGMIGACKALLKNGITPGKETALIGFDGLPCGRTFQPSFASVAQPVREIAEEVFSVIRNWKPQSFVHRLLQPALQPGETLGNNNRPASEKAEIPVFQEAEIS